MREHNRCVIYGNAEEAFTRFQGADPPGDDRGKKGTQPRGRTLAKWGGLNYRAGRIVNSKVFEDDALGG